MKMKQILILLVLNLILFVNIGLCIQCYKCESIDGSNPECELGIKKEIPYHNPCQVGSSLIKGNRCIKIVGTAPSSFDRRTIVIRDCTDKAHTKEDGYISFDRYTIRGRAYTCKSNLCNSSPGLLNKIDLIKFTVIVCLTILFSRIYK